MARVDRSFRMTKEDVANFIAEKVAEIGAVREDGQKEYAHDDDRPFRNFEVRAEELHIPREKVLWSMMAKHSDGILAYVNGHRSQRESVHGRFKDLHLYLYLLEAMIHEDEVNSDE